MVVSFARCFIAGYVYWRRIYPNVWYSNDRYFLLFERWFRGDNCCQYNNEVRQAQHFLLEQQRESANNRGKMLSQAYAEDQCLCSYKWEYDNG